MHPSLPLFAIHSVPGYLHTTDEYLFLKWFVLRRIKMYLGAFRGALGRIGCIYSSTCIMGAHRCTYCNTGV